MVARRSLRLAFSDFWQGFEPSTWPPLRVLRRAFEVELDPAAEILVCGPYSLRHIRHGGTKVLWTHEPWDYNRGEYDFTVSFDPLNDPTHLRFPNFAAHMIGDALEGRTWRRPNFDVWRRRPYFCNFIYANEAAAARNAFFRALSRRRHIMSPGRVYNNTMPIPGDRSVQDWRRRKLAYQSSFRFSIAFENVSRAGYTSEKLRDALCAGTIPIYWGNRDVGNDVDKTAFIDAADFDSFDELADHVCRVEADVNLASAYLATESFMLQPVDDWICDLTSFFERIADFSPPFVRQQLRAVRLRGRAIRWELRARAGQRISSALRHAP
jgi:hypothetical protein